MTKMKRILFSFVYCMTAAGLWAQNTPHAALVGLQETADGMTLSIPRSAIAVDVTVTAEQVVSGPYARYAMKYLSIKAPFTDKVTYRIDGARLALMTDDTLLAPEALEPPVQQAVAADSNPAEFPALAVDRSSITPLTDEAAAQKAAETIFALRKSRMELITGFTGENVFGAGLRAALDEIARLEQAYLELFIGRRVVTTSTRRYIVEPEASNRQYIVCRFSDTDGLLPDTDLSGEVVLLKIEPGKTPSVVEAPLKSSVFVECRLAASSLCVLQLKNRELARQQLPLYEFGRTVRLAVPKR